jgi:hypothetical protein
MDSKDEHSATGLHHGPGDLAVLGGALVLSGGVALYLLADLRSSPTGFLAGGTG